MNRVAAKWYTRIIGAFFVLVFFSLVSDYLAFGFGPETMHKVFHVILGAIVVWFGWRSEAWWRTFPLANGAFFSFVAVFGLLFPDFGGLDAFNRLDTILHSIVGVSGLAIGFFAREASPTNEKQNPKHEKRTTTNY